MEPNHSIKSSFSCNGVSEEKDQKAFANYQRILALLAEVSAQPGVEVAFDIQMRVGSPSEHPPLPPSPPPEHAEDSACDICGDLSEWVQMDTERGICMTCADHLDESLKYYTEEFAHASANGKDALSLLVLRQRADNCRDLIAAAAGSYDGYLELHEASVEEKLLNKRAAECLARLPASFAPWWKDTWSHEKWCQIDFARETTGWALASKDAPIVQRLAAMFLTEQHKVKELEANMAAVTKASAEASCAVGEAAEKIRHDARRRGYADGYAFADQKATKVIQALRADLERLRAENKGLHQQMVEDKQVVQRHLKEVAKGNDEATTWEKEEIERLRKDVRAHEARVGRLGDMAKRDMEAITKGHAEIKKLEAQVEELRMELASAKGSLEGTEVAARAVTDSSTQVVEGLRKELTTTKTDLIRAQDSAKNLEGEVDAATKLFQAMRSDLEGLNAENKALRKKNEALLELVEPTVKLMTSNPELFGGEARGTSSPHPPPIIRLPPIKEEDKERALNFLKSIVVPPRPCLWVESTPTVLPGIVEAEPSTEGLCMALTKAQYEEIFDDELPPLIPLSAAPSPPVVPDEPTVCGAAGCIDCPPLEPVPEPDTTRVSCVGCGKPKPNYNHPNWPSPITKRFAKHLAKHSGLRGQDPKSIKTHEDALEYIAKRSNISVETLLQWTMSHYQSFSEPWTLVEGPNKFHMGTAPATWWC